MTRCDLRDVLWLYGFWVGGDDPFFQVVSDFYVKKKRFRLFLLEFFCQFSSEYSTSYQYTITKHSLKQRLYNHLSSTG